MSKSPNSEDKSTGNQSGQNRSARAADREHETLYRILLFHAMIRNAPSLKMAPVVPAIQRLVAGAGAVSTTRDGNVTAALLS